MRPDTTRKQAAAELLERVQRGPAFGAPGMDWTEKHAQQAAERYRLWARTWIIPELERLVPELAKREPAPTPAPAPNRRTETATTRSEANARVHQLRIAGYQVQAVDTDDAILIHIASGKHGDLTKLPPPRSA